MKPVISESHLSLESWRLPANRPATPAFEQVSCLFGHTEPAEELFERPDWWFGLPGDFTWHRCSKCGLLFLSPRPTLSSIATYYPPEYAAYSPAIDDERWPWMRWKRRRNLRAQVAAVNRNATRGHLLDVGCATGNYLAEMRRHGWEVQGVELQAAAAAYARARFNLKVFTGDLLHSRLPDNHFDVVTMWNVLEHTHDPLAILREVYRLLKPGGLVVFSIPDPDSKEAQAFGPAWIGYDAPRHLYLFHNVSLDCLLMETGFALLEKQHSLATYHTWVASWHTQLNHRLAATLLRWLLVKGAYLPFWAPLTAPYFHWLNNNGRGSIVTIYAHARAHARPTA